RRFFVPTEGRPGPYPLGELPAFSGRPGGGRAGGPPPPPHEKGVPPAVRELIGPYAEVVRLLGRRTAELHLALASDADAGPDFAPEPFSLLHQRSRYQYLRILSTQAFRLLRQCLHSLPEAVRGEARRALMLEEELGQRLRSMFSRKITALRLR